ncbi:glutathione S-transferase family protein [Psychromonas sp. KJ10-10]|uniref:glutathione S-transferase family protein n=1 Tax=Psychromonas sp. KJ10-10 TaxID=3391823 RepID=UPI0039B56C95
MKNWVYTANIVKSIFVAGEQKSEQYLKVNPFGKVPALLVDGKLLTENPAILIYLNSLPSTNEILPKANDAFHQSQIYSDLMWLSSTLHPSVRHVCVPSYYTISENKEDVIERGRIALSMNLNLAEKRLVGSQWWYGDKWSIVDTYLHWCYTRAERGGYSLENFPALGAHQKRVEKMPSYAKRKSIENNNL